MQKYKLNLRKSRKIGKFLIMNHFDSTLLSVIFAYMLEIV